MLNNVAQRNRVLSLVERGLWTNQMAAESLGISRRHIQRLKGRVERTHEPRIPWNRKSQEVCELVVAAKVEYPHRSNERIAELIRERLGEPLSAPTVRKILIEQDKYEPRERLVRSYGKFEASSFGELLQLDTTEGCWLPGYRRIYLILLLDDYSRTVVGFKWVDSDSTWNNLLVIRSTIERYGLAGGIYTDNSGKFKVIRHGQSYHQKHRDNSEYETEIQRVMRELGVPFFSHKPFEPTSKGKIERLFGFIQSRFIPEHTATNLEELNEQFANWVAWYNNCHRNRITGCVPKERVTPEGWTPLLGKDDLNRFFCYKVTRKVDKLHQFSYEGTKYTLPEEPCVVACTVSLEVTPETIRAYWHDQLLVTFKREQH